VDSRGHEADHAIGDAAMTSVRLEHIVKHFAPSAAAVDDVSLSVSAGELFFLLGPSGCGKSTLLRIIAGIVEPSAGQVFFNDRDVTSLPTERRNAVMCFQSYALWPHMTVLQNVRFGLEARNFPADQRDRLANDALSLVRLDDLANRKPNELSGGQQQRVALARALAVKPDCLLLDEPLSNLDAKLRTQMRGEIRRICKSGSFTTIYVTHDQKEALSIADRIAVLNAGKLIQVGTPTELYQRPRTRFVADFLGQANILPATVLSRDGGMLRLQTSAGVIRALCDQATADAVSLSIRPEKIRLMPANAPANGAINRLSGTVVSSAFLGESSEYTVAVDGQNLTVLATPPPADLPREVALEFDPADVVVLAD
jgi:iron(III) transport system ATP-binding protein